jgi:hypothetical protein
MRRKARVERMFDHFVVVETLGWRMGTVCKARDTL